MPFCQNCGHELSEQAVSCTSCGHPGPAFRAGAGAVAPTATEGSAITALVLGILGVILCPLILSVPAIIVGRSAQRKIEADPALGGEGMAKAGVVLGWVGTGLAIAGLVLVIGTVFLGTRTSSTFSCVAPSIGGLTGTC